METETQNDGPITRKVLLIAIVVLLMGMSVFAALDFLKYGPRAQEERETAEAVETVPDPER